MNSYGSILDPPLGIFKNSTIEVTVDDLRDGVIVVSYSSLDNQYQGVLLQLHRDRGIPYGISFPKNSSCSSKGLDSNDPSQISPLSQRYTYFQDNHGNKSPRSDLRRIIKPPARFKNNNRMQLRHRVKPLLCVKCKSLCDGELLEENQNKKNSQNGGNKRGGGGGGGGIGKKSDLTAIVNDVANNGRQKVLESFDDDLIDSNIDKYKFKGVGNKGILENYWTRPNPISFLGDKGGGRSSINNNETYETQISPKLSKQMLKDKDVPPLLTEINNPLPPLPIMTGGLNSNLNESDDFDEVFPMPILQASMDVNMTDLDTEIKENGINNIKYNKNIQTKLDKKHGHGGDKYSESSSIGIPISSTNDKQNKSYNNRNRSKLKSSSAKRKDRRNLKLCINKLTEGVLTSTTTAASSSLNSEVKISPTSTSSSSISSTSSSSFSVKIPEISPNKISWGDQGCIDQEGTSWDNRFRKKSSVPARFRDDCSKIFKFKRRRVEDEKFRFETSSSSNSSRETIQETDNNLEPKIPLILISSKIPSSSSSSLSQQGTEGAEEKHCLQLQETTTTSTSLEDKDLPPPPGNYLISNSPNIENIIKNNSESKKTKNVIKIAIDPLNGYVVIPPIATNKNKNFEENKNYEDLEAKAARKALKKAKKASKKKEALNISSSPTLKEEEEVPIIEMEPEHPYLSPNDDHNIPLIMDSPPILNPEVPLQARSYSPDITCSKHNPIITTFKEFHPPPEQSDNTSVISNKYFSHETFTFEQYDESSVHSSKKKKKKKKKKAKFSKENNSQSQEEEFSIPIQAQWKEFEEGNSNISTSPSQNSTSFNQNPLVT